MITVYGVGETRTLGGAAKLAFGPALSGWHTWHVERNGELVMLDVIRTEYMRQAGT